MRDPHVSTLIYRIETDETVLFDNPEPLERETDAFRVRLADGVLRLEMKEHHASEQSARDRAEPYIRAWELSEALHLGWRAIRFIFEKAEIVDRDPPPPGVIEVRTADGVYVVGGSPTVLLTHRRQRYPEPPTGFVVTPNVETMWNRFEGYRAGREPLTSMAYMCLTVLEVSAGGGTEAAAKRYGISSNVLRELRRLASEVGDEHTARKVTKQHKSQRHTGAQIAWMEAVIRAMIRRAGEWAFDPSVTRPQLTMVDFPELT